MKQRWRQWEFGGASCGIVQQDGGDGRRCGWVGTVVDEEKGRQSGFGQVSFAIVQQKGAGWLEGM